MVIHFHMLSMDSGRSADLGLLFAYTGIQEW